MLESWRFFRFTELDPKRTQKSKHLSQRSQGSQRGTDFVSNPAYGRIGNKDSL
jgi:hypothetical protein